MTGKIKNFTNIFKRYKNPYLSLDKRFIVPDDKSVALENIYNKSLESNSFGAFMQYKKATALSKVTDTDNAVTVLLDVFTGDYSDEFFEGFSQYQQERFSEILDIQTEDRNRISITLKDGRIIDATKLSFLYPKITEYYPYVLDRGKRKGRCHTMSVALACGLTDNTNIVTGSVYTLLSRAKYLHSWVEDNVDGEDYCYDFIYNIIMKQEDYYSLFHAKPYEKISAKQFKNDFDDFSKLMNVSETYCKLYLSSREEALSIAKNLPDIENTK